MDTSLLKISSMRTILKGKCEVNGATNAEIRRLDGTPRHRNQGAADGLRQQGGDRCLPAQAPRATLK